MAFLSALGDRYLSIGASLLAALQPSSIDLNAREDSSLLLRGPRFKWPFNGFN